jgi:hypothetical protein
MKLMQKFKKFIILGGGGAIQKITPGAEILNYCSEPTTVSFHNKMLMTSFLLHLQTNPVVLCYCIFL